MRVPGDETRVLIWTTPVDLPIWRPDTKHPLDGCPAKVQQSQTRCSDVELAADFSTNNSDSTIGSVVQVDTAPNIDTIKVHYSLNSGSRHLKPAANHAPDHFQSFQVDNVTCGQSRADIDLFELHFVGKETPNQIHPV